MFDQIPSRVWLLIAIAAIAWAPAYYAFRHIAASPSRRDITQPPVDLSWRTSGDLVRSLVILAALAGVAIFIFTPPAEALAKSPSFWPILIACMGAWALFTVPQGIISGKVEPFVRGVSETYDRETQPKRFWASLVWNGILGLMCIGFANPMYKGMRDQPLEDRCFYYDKGESPQERIAACNELISRTDKTKDEFGDALAGRASAYSRIGDYQRALADNSNAIRLRPDASYIRFNRALIYDVTGDLPRALADYNEAIRLDPDDAGAHLNRGRILLDNGRFDVAIDAFTKAHELQPKDAFPLANRGMAYAWKNDRARAQADFEKARRLDPSNAVVLHGKGLLAMNSNDMKLAVSLLTASLDAEPDNRMALAMRAEAYGYLGEHEKAQADRKRMEKLPSRWLPIGT